MPRVLAISISRFTGEGIRIIIVNKGIYSGGAYPIDESKPWGVKHLHSVYLGK